MSHRSRSLLFVLVILSAAVTGAGRATEDRVPKTHAVDAAARQKIEAKYGALPLTFETNVGQADSAVQFLVRGPGHSTFLGAGGEVTVVGPSDRPGKDAALRIRLHGGRADAPARGGAPLPGRINYLKGANPSEWRTAVPAFSKVAYDDVYPGIDLVYYGNQRRLEYDFVVAPGADPGRIGLEFAGADSLDIQANGDLIAHVGGREIVQRKPVIYQNISGDRREVAGAYVRRGASQIAFEVGEYDRSRELIIDPILLYSTFLGGGAVDAYEGSPFGIAVDASGSVYVTGLTHSTDFPTTPGAFDSTRNGDADVFVTKLNPSGSALEYSTYIGGSQFDTSKGLALDAAGNAYVTGYTNSSDFPATQGAWDTQMSGGPDAFVLKLDSFGALRYSTFLGGSSYDLAYGIVVDGEGRASVTGYTFPGGPVSFPTRAGAVDTTHNGEADVFVTTLYADGSELVYSTFIGGSANDVGQGLAIDANGLLYVTGYTYSGNFPVTQSVWDTAYGGGGDVFVVKLDPSRSDRLVYATYLGGSGLDEGADIALDAAGSAYVTGNTSSINFPTTQGAWDRGMSGGPDAFVTKLYPDGSELRYSTFLGGGSYDLAYGIAVDAAGRAYVTGYTFPAPLNFPTRPGALDTTHNGEADAFVTTLYADGSELLFSTYFGGQGVDVGHGLAIDNIGNVYVAGYTFSANFPSSATAFDTGHNGSGDGFVLAINVIDFPPTIHRVPSDMLVEATGPGGAVATWTSPYATDAVDGEIGVTCAPAAGTVFSLGTTTVSCSATDSAGHVVTGFFIVTVVDTTPPSLTGVPADIVSEATGPSGAAVTWTVPTVADNVDAEVAVSCSPASGSTFPLGTTIVTCSAIDDAGNLTIAEGRVLVRDTIAPTVVITEPGRDAIIVTTPTLVSVVASDVVGVRSIAVSVTPAYPYSGASHVASAQLTSGTVQHGTWRASVPVDWIENSFSVVTTDSQGNETVTRVIVDNDGIDAAIDKSQHTLADASSFASTYFASGETVGFAGLQRVRRIHAFPAGSGIQLEGILSEPGNDVAGGANYLCTGAAKGLTLRLGNAIRIACTGPTLTMIGVSGSVSAWKHISTTCYYRANTYPYCYDNYLSAVVGPGDHFSWGSPIVVDPDSASPIHIDLVRVRRDEGQTEPVLDDLTNSEVFGSFEVEPSESVNVTVTPGAAGEPDVLTVSVIKGTVAVTLAGETKELQQGQQSDLVIDVTPPVIGATPNLTVEATSAVGAAVTYVIPVGDDLDPSPAVTTSPASGSVFPIGATPVTVTAKDGAGNTSTATFTVTVGDSTPPVLTMPADIVADPTSFSGASVTFAVSAADAVAGVVAVACDRASGDSFPIGTQQVRCSGADTSGNSAERTFSVTVRPPAAPRIDLVTPSLSSLWPANHQMVTLTLTISARDAFGGSVSCGITAISSNEPTNGTGDGDTAPDWTIGSGLRFELRAERAGTVIGRIYTVAVTCSDQRGSSTQATAVVTVPKAERN